MKVEIIPCLQDNYSYLMIDETNNTACVIDPSEAEPIINFIEKKNIHLKYSQVLWIYQFLTFAQHISLHR